MSYEGRRLKAFPLGEEWVRDLLKYSVMGDRGMPRARYMPVFKSDLPENAEMLWLMQDLERACWVAVFECPTWPALGRFEKIPVVELDVFRCELDERYRVTEPVRKEPIQLKSRYGQMVIGGIAEQREKFKRDLDEILDKIELPQPGKIHDLTCAALGRPPSLDCFCSSCNIAREVLTPRLVAKLRASTKCVVCAPPVERGEIDNSNPAPLCGMHFDMMGPTDRLLRGQIRNGPDNGKFLTIMLTPHECVHDSVTYGIARAHEHPVGHPRYENVMVSRDEHEFGKARGWSRIDET